MKLFAFKPDAYGPQSYFVLAENEEAARQNVKEHYEKEWNTKDHTQWGALDSVDDGEPVYYLQIYELGQVASNDNA